VLQGPGKGRMNSRTQPVTNDQKRASHSDDR
jgi:hypothetical protein